MKNAVLFSSMGILAAFGTVAQAQEVGRVISSTPAVQQVAVPRQVCTTQTVMQQQPSSGGGAVVGAIVGGLLGNTIGGGMGRAAATGVGVVAGAAIGDQVANGQRQQAMQQCSTQTTYENRTVGYNVVYEYAGKQFTTQMPYDPGPTVRLQVSPMGSSGGAAMSAPTGSNSGVITAPPMGQSAQGDTQPAPAGVPIINAAPVYAQPVMVGAPAYPVYYSPYYSPYGSYYPPVALSLSFGYGGGWGGGHYHHWR